MKLVTRYVVREHVGPLLFALSALTSLLMLQYVARQLANLAGKGLPWKAIAQFFVLSLPFTIAMTLPMAVLVATLHAFGRMAAEHEITANCIGPGTIDVERDPNLKAKNLRPTQPIRRMGKSQEVVSLMLYLASEDAGFITGQNYLVNGGMYFQ